ncbi:MAG: hypothetical protein LBK70_03235 [Clostridiales bacterium]|jgi:predicted  nucleic acid-binding Zn-ribbon protein|nr:hypothetical protein [Clostridiales bacterium]
MTKLESILEYQTIDIQRRRKLIEIETSDCAKRAYIASQEFAKAKQVILENETKAIPLVAHIDNIRLQYLELQSEIKDLQTAVENAQSEEILENLLGKLYEYKSRLSDIDKRMQDNIAQSKDILKVYKTAQQTGKEAQDVYKDNKKQLEDLKDSNKVVLDNFDRQLSELDKKCDKELLSIYQELTKERKEPAFVALVGDDTCRGCGIQMSQKTLSSLNNNNICRCDYCRRVVYRA